VPGLSPHVLAETVAQLDFGVDGEDRDGGHADQDDQVIPPDTRSVPRGVSREEPGDGEEDGDGEEGVDGGAEGGAEIMTGESAGLGLDGLGGECFVEGAVGAETGQEGSAAFAVVVAVARFGGFAGEAGSGDLVGAVGLEGRRSAPWSLANRRGGAFDAMETLGNTPHRMGVLVVLEG
jgi:hypothetical protein